MGGTTRAGRDQRRAVAGEARDAVDTRGLNRSARVLPGRVVVSRRARIGLPARRSHSIAAIAIPYGRKNGHIGHAVAIANRLS